MMASMACSPNQIIEFTSSGLQSRKAYVKVTVNSLQAAATLTIVLFFF
jgi:hypothetical protein